MHTQPTYEKTGPINISTLYPTLSTFKYIPLLQQFLGIQMHAIKLASYIAMSSFGFNLFCRATQ